MFSAKKTKTEQNTLPSAQFYNHIHGLINKTNNLMKTEGFLADLKSTLKLLCQTDKDLFNAIEKEEKYRPEFQINTSLIDKQEELESKLKKIRAHEQKEFSVHEQKLAQLDSKIELIHNQILEATSNSTLQKVDGLVKDNQMHLAIEEEINSLTNEIEDQGCCTRYILCCFTPGNIKKSSSRIKQLQDEKKALESNDVSKKSEYITSRLNKKRDELEAQREQLALNHPKYEGDRLSDALAQVTSEIEGGEKRHYAAVGNETMFQLIRNYALYLRMVEKLCHLASNDVTTDLKTPLLENPLLPIYVQLKDSYLDALAKIENQIDQIWCPHSNNNNARSIFNKFIKLSGAEQDNILVGSKVTAEDIEKLIPLQEIESVTLTYHPLGVNPKLPANCPVVTALRI